MSAHEKFLFDMPFEIAEDDALGPNGQPARKALEEARAEGFADGKQAGADEIRRSIEQQMVQALDAISQQLGVLCQAQIDAVDRQARETVETATVIVRKLFPKLANSHGLAEIEALVRECLERLREEPRIVIRVADQMLDEIQSRIGALATRCGFDGKIVFLAQEDLEPSDVHIEWADGGAERDSKHLWRTIDEVINRVAGIAPKPPHDAELPAASESNNESTAEPASPGPARDDAVVSA